MAAGRGPAGEIGEVGDERLAGAEVEAGRRLVEEEQVRIGHQGAGDRGPPPLAGGQRPVRLIRERADARSASRARARARSSSV